MILYLNCQDNPITWNKKNYLLAAAKRLGWTDVRDFAETFEQPEYVLNIEPCVISKGSKWTGLWHIDVLCDDTYYHNQYGVVDSVFIANVSTRYPYERAQVLFQAADPVLHRRDPGALAEYDFAISGSMGGSLYQKRSDLIDILKTQFTFVDNGKDKRPQEYVNGLNRAKIQFIRSMDVDGKGEIAQRFFECLAIGPVLTNYVVDLESTGLEQWKDYLAYCDETEMVEKMQWLVDHPEEAHKIAENGRKKVLLYHTYEHRLMSIFNTIKEYEHY